MCAGLLPSVSQASLSSHAGEHDLSAWGWGGVRKPSEGEGLYHVKAFLLTSGKAFLAMTSTLL